ncbi:MAG: pitrilysin family protein [Candidatus Eisenbacteria bacterium]|nr:pitrilysin family protein [Candidatus Eisenbacteria bacterium]
MKKLLVLFIISIVLFSSGLLCAFENFKAVQDSVVEHTLKNGLRIIILPRREVPVVSLATYADVGSVNETKGITGLAHIFEHMAFKGTTSIGTKDIKKEIKAMDRLDDAYLSLKDPLKRKQGSGEQADAMRVAKLEKEFEEAEKDASSFVIDNQFGQIVQEAGGVGLNAWTSADATVYHYSLPSNKLELWMSLESDRFLNPVLRDFYKEKRVIMEERRMGESNPIGKLIEEFLAMAYKAHPYGEPTIGHMSDLETITRQEAQRFFNTYYVPSNLVIGIAGDVDPKEVMGLAETYFGRIPAKPRPEPVETVEPPQQGERREVMEEESQPIIVIGYHKGSATDKDAAVFSAIADIMSNGRTSRLYRSLVRDKKVATMVGGLSNEPGKKYPGLFIFYGFPAPGRTNQEVEEAIDEQTVKLKTELVDEATLRKAKTRARADLLRELSSNMGMATTLTEYEAVTGDWRNLFKELDQIDAVTAEDIKRVANECFVKRNKTVAAIEKSKEPE